MQIGRLNRRSFRVLSRVLSPKLLVIAFRILEKILSRLDALQLQIDSILKPRHSTCHYMPSLLSPSEADSVSQFIAQLVAERCHHRDGNAECSRQFEIFTPPTTPKKQVELPFVAPFPDFMTNENSPRVDVSINLNPSSFDADGQPTVAFPLPPLDSTTGLDIEKCPDSCIPDAQTEPEYERDFEADPPLLSQPLDFSSVALAEIDSELPSGDEADDRFDPLDMQPLESVAYKGNVPHERDVFDSLLDDYALKCALLAPTAVDYCFGHERSELESPLLATSDNSIIASWDGDWDFDSSSFRNDVTDVASDAKPSPPCVEERQITVYEDMKD